jgi:hypothetical protein
MAATRENNKQDGTMDGNCIKWRIDSDSVAIDYELRSCGVLSARYLLHAKKSSTCSRSAHWRNDGRHVRCEK